MVYHQGVTQSNTTNKQSVPPANRLGLDYAAQAKNFPYSGPIIDAHAHINGLSAVQIYRRIADAYGILMTYSMTKLEEAEAIRDALEGRVRYIAVPDYWNQENMREAMTTGFIQRIEAYHALGSRIAKFWAAPRAIDYAVEMGDPNLMRLDAPHRIEAMEVAHSLGMMIMAHVADPDTWFATKYKDASVYGTKLQQYEPLEILLDRFTQPWVVAHFGGWPEDLEWLSGLLDRHDNLYLDTSACKWIVREISHHPREEIIAFLQKYQGRILFGSDIVTDDAHLDPPDPEQREIYHRANSEAEAYDLYASRYWALRTLWETDYRGESPIADPDLAMVDPEKFSEDDAPQLHGKSLPPDILRSLYHDAAEALMDPLHQDT